MNDKYYRDIKNFPNQFAKGLEIAKDIKIEGDFNRIVICAMGGSAFYAHIINDILKRHKENKLLIDIVNTYNIPENSNINTLYIICSVSGNTEETLSCFDEIEVRGYKGIVMTGGGELERKARDKNMPLILIPKDTQPRLSIGYLLSSLVKVLENSNLIVNISDELLKSFNSLPYLLDQDIEDYAKNLANRLLNSLPIILSDDIIKSAALTSKIKFNENSKVPCYYNVFPEFNHNEMVGYTNIFTKIFFLILESKYSHNRVYKRMEIFKKLMLEKNINVEIIKLKGESLTEEILYSIYLVDHITYYLADYLNIDPEPVEMVERFKGMMME